MAIVKTPRQSLVSIMEHGLQLRKEIHSIREQFKGILDAPPAHNNSTPRAPGCSSPRTPLQPLCTPRSRGPRMGCAGVGGGRTGAGAGAGDSNNNNNASNKMAPPNALVALQNYIRNRTPVKRKLSAAESTPSKLCRLSSSSSSYDDKENVSNKSDTPSTKSRRSLRRFSAGSRDSLKKLLSPKRRSVVRTVRRSPILTNGILIRNKEGELINPPFAAAVSAATVDSAPSARKRLLVDPQSELPQSPCVIRSLGARSCGDGQELKPVRTSGSKKSCKPASNNTVELSAADYSRSPDTFYVIDKLKEKTLATTFNSPLSTKWRVNTGVSGCIQQAVQKMIPDKTYMSETKDKTLGELSMISRLGEATIREQPSALINTSGPAADVLHSTLNYPLHSTMYLEGLSCRISDDGASDEEEEECDSSVMSFCVDESPFRTPPSSAAAVPAGNCDVCKILKRQTGQGRLQHPRKAVALSESDFLFERTCLHDSLDATRGTEANLSEVQDSTLVSTSIMDQTTVRDVTLCNSKRKSLSSSTASSSKQHKSIHKSRHHKRGRQSSDKSRSISIKPSCDSDSDKENSTNHHQHHHPSIISTQSKTSHWSASSDVTSSSFTSSLSHDKKRQLKRRLKKFNSRVHSQNTALDIKTLGFF